MIPLAVALFSAIVTLPTSASVLAAARSASGRERLGRDRRSISVANVPCESGLRLQAHLRLDRSQSLDTVIVPGGGILRTTQDARQSKRRLVGGRISGASSFEHASLQSQIPSYFGSTPAAFVENLRLDEARWRLANGSASIELVAASVGYRSDDAFRRAFQRHFGIAPSDYRERFPSAERDRLS